MVDPNKLHRMLDIITEYTTCGCAVVPCTCGKQDTIDELHIEITKVGWTLAHIDAILRTYRCPLGGDAHLSLQQIDEYLHPLFTE